MACGLPVVCSDFPLWERLVGDADCGVVVDPRDPPAVAAAIEQLLKDPDEARRLGENGRRAVLDRFNWEAEFVKLEALYRKLAVTLVPSACSSSRRTRTTLSPAAAARWRAGWTTARRCTTAVFSTAGLSLPSGSPAYRLKDECNAALDQLGLPADDRFICDYRSRARPPPPEVSRPQHLSLCQRMPSAPRYRRHSRAIASTASEARLAGQRQVAEQRDVHDLEGPLTQRERAARRAGRTPGTRGRSRCGSPPRRRSRACSRSASPASSQFRHVTGFTHCR